MTARLEPQAWMTSRATAAVLDALEAAGGPGCARFVGGCVRNALMGRPVDDIDIATTLEPPAVIRALEAAGLKAVPTGVEHGTVTAVSERRPYEITTLRRDVSTDGRRAVVAFTDDWAEDAQRRDFRFNALFADRDGTLFDPTGHGVQDARDGRVVFVGDPAQRIREDALRILRFFRFHAWFGAGAPDAAALTACAEGVALLEGLSAERCQKELLKLLGAEDPVPAVELMRGSGALEVLLPQADGFERLARLVALQRGVLHEADPVLRLAALAAADSAAAADTVVRLRLSNSQGERLSAVAASAPDVREDMTPAALRAAVYRAGSGTVADRLTVAWAEAGGDETRWLALLDLARTWTPPRLPITGEDIMAAGVAQGPQVGRVLRTVEDWWIARDFPDDRDQLLQWAGAAVEEG